MPTNMKGTPMSLSRRNFLFVSSGAAAGTMLVTGLAEATEGGLTNSGLVTGRPKPLRHKAISGFLSAEQIAPHYTAHYGGALKGYTSLDNKLETSIKAGTTIDTNSYGSMQRARQRKGNSVILHELYTVSFLRLPILRPMFDRPLKGGLVRSTNGAMICRPVPRLLRAGQCWCITR